MTAAGEGQVGRIPSGRFRELGPVNWVMAKVAARRMRVPEMHLFTTLGQRQLLYWTWSMYGARLLRGRLPAIDAGRALLLHPGGPSRKHVKTPDGHRFSLLVQRRNVSAVECL